MRRETRITTFNIIFLALEEESVRNLWAGLGWVGAERERELVVFKEKSRCGIYSQVHEEVINYETS